MKKIVLEGPIPAVVTPFNEAGDLQLENLKSIIEDYLGYGVTAIVVGGHNGENWALSRPERVQVVKAAAEQIRGRVPLVCGVGGSSPIEKIEICKEAGDAGADAIMTEAPYVISTATDDEIYGHFEQIARGMDLPIMLYNNPRRTQINIKPQLIDRMCEIDSIVSLKESTRDFGQLSETINLCGDKISVLVGPASAIYPGVTIGAKGYVSTGPLDFMGRDGVRLYEAARDHDHETAMALHFRAALLYSTLFGLGTWPSALKAGLNLLGKPAGVPRRPVNPLSAAQIEQLRSRMQQAGVL